MKRLLVLAPLVLFLAWAPTADAQKKKVDPKLPNVLIIGDSISIGYMGPTEKLLTGKANLYHNPGNAESTDKGLAKLKDWLGEGKWDVIHFNWGLHDIKLGTGKHQVPIEEYEKNLREVVKKLKATNAKLIFATTTPVPEGKLSPPRKNDDVIAYNKIAKKIMEENGVAINDLYAFALPQLDKIQQPVNVHFTNAGSAVLAERVAAAIEKALTK